MKKLVTLLLAALLVMSALTACSGGATPSETPANTPASETPASPETPESPEPSKEPEPENSARQDFVFTDDCGREVDIPGTVTRIAASGPMSQIVLFAIAPEMFVGTADDWTEEARGIIPDEYFNMPKVGQIYGGKEQVNREELALLDPEIVIDVGEAKKGIADDLNELQEQTGVTFVHIEASLETMPQAYRRLGELLGKEEEGEAIASYLEGVWDRTVDIMDKVGDNKVKAVYCLGLEGLSVLAKTSYHAQLIDMLTDNVAVVDDVSSKGTGNAVDLEQLLVWDPDYIIFAPDGTADSAKDDQWQGMTAIQNGNTVVVPNVPYNWLGSPPSVQRYLGLIWLPAVLYPEYVDYDVYEACAEYFQIFYHADLTREAFDAIAGSALAD